MRGPDVREPILPRRAEDEPRHLLPDAAERVLPRGEHAEDAQDAADAAAVRRRRCAQRNGRPAG